MKVKFSMVGYRPGRIYVLKSVGIPKRFRCWSWSSFAKHVRAFNP